MSIELPPLHWVGAMQIDNASFQSLATEASVEARERILLARIAELHKDLADCYRLTGADPDGNEDWRLARHAVKEVAAMRTDLDLAEARIAELEADAERYRWLRKRNELTGEVDPRGPYCIEDDDGDTHYPTGAELDAAIDAARKA